MIVSVQKNVCLLKKSLEMIHLFPRVFSSNFSQKWTIDLFQLLRKSACSYIVSNSINKNT